MFHKRVLVLGSDGFVGRHLVTSLSEHFSVTGVGSRNVVDLRIATAVESFFANSVHFDYVFLCASTGGSRLRPETEEIMEENVAMVDNVMRCERAFDVIVLFGSGAEFDRSKPVDRVLELWPVPPPEGQWYGRAKYFIRAKYGAHPKVVNWRIISCYGPDDIPQRFIASCFRAKKEGEMVTIDLDRQFDFVYIDHICDAAKRLIEGDVRLRRNFNLCYRDKRTLSEVADRLGVPARVLAISALHYTGEADDYFTKIYDWPF